MNADPSRTSTRTPFFRNWLGLVGLVIAIGSFFSFLLLFAIDLFGHEASPYLGILTFVVAPAFLILGLFLIAIGWLLQRRRIAKSGGAPLALDWSQPRTRRKMVVFALCAAAFLLLSAFGSYRTYHFAESVTFCGQVCHTPMQPEYTTYLNSPHARVACTACHVGPGVTSFVKAKLNGVHQLIATVADDYHRPISTPKNLRPAQETCEECHWSKKYIGNVNRTYTHYLPDETNTVSTVKLLLKVGGGDPTHGPVGGIHWHMNIANKVEFVSTNGNRQVIPWVRLTDAQGKVTEFKTDSFKEDPAKYPVHTMDCLDCHNRPAHQFRSPLDAVDVTMALGKIDAKIPLLKSNLVAVLSLTNQTQAEGLQKIATTLRAQYPKETKMETVIAETQKIYQNNFFPEMKADWRVYPDNIGHMGWPGCFRCHDGLHKTADGKRTIAASDCNSCHLIIAQGNGSQLDQMLPKGLKFAHPDAASDGDQPNCTDCHSNNQ